MSTTQITQRGPYEYPTRDYRACDGDIHRDTMFDATESLSAYFAGKQVYVTGNLLTFYRKGDPTRLISPDVMVAKGVPPGLRLNYLIWEEGVSPQLVIEITSIRTMLEDLKVKLPTYRAAMQVSEFFLFDPCSDYLSPRLQGFRLTENRYVPIEPLRHRIPSDVLGLHLEGDQTWLRFYEPTAGQWIPQVLHRHENLSGAYLR